MRRPQLGDEPVRLFIRLFALGSMGWRARLGGLVQMAAKSNRLADESRLGDDSAVTLLGQPNL